MAGGQGGQWVCPDPMQGTTLALTKLSWGEGLSGEWKKVGLNIDGLESSEVCALLGISEGNQRVLLHRARTAVRHALERYLAVA